METHGAWDSHSILHGPPTPENVLDTGSSTKTLKHALLAELGLKFHSRTVVGWKEDLKKKYLPESQESVSMALFANKIFADTTDLKISRQDHPGFQVGLKSL